MKSLATKQPYVQLEQWLASFYPLLTKKANTMLAF